MSAPLLALRGIGFGHAGHPPVLRDVDATVGEGELVVLFGPTGVGKSTLLGVVGGQTPRFTGGTLTGAVLLDGHDITRTPPRERAADIGYVGQDPARGFVTDTVEEELAYGMEQLGVDAATMRRRVEETLDLLGIAELRERDLRTLSGGQQQRVAIGAVLTMHPRLLVLDEPTSALDPTAAEEVLATLTRLVHDLGVSVLLAEHRLERVVPFADEVWLLGGGRLRTGAPVDVLAEAPIVPPLVELGRALDWSPLPLSVREARRRVRDLPPLAGRPTRAADSDGLVALAARGLTVVHAGHPGQAARPAVHDVDLDLPVGRVTALMGRNGSGKSSLLWALQGSGRRYAGSVRVPGPDGPLDPAEQPAGRRRALVGLLPQDPDDLLYLETVAEELAAAGADRALLERLVPGVPDDSHPRDLSEGQRLGVALAVVLADEPPVCLLDEPTRGLDYAAKDALAATLRGLAAGGSSVLVASHDVEFVARVADDVVVLADGEVISRGPVAEVVAQSPAFAPQVHKVLGSPWLRVDQVLAALGAGA